MESCGEALKIHISPQCKEKLDKLGGYITEERGLISMKGKGEVLTYWLIGTKNNDFFFNFIKRMEFHRYHRRRYTKAQF